MQQQEKPKRWWNDGALFMYGLIRSNYVTAIEEWFMGLAGKLVNIVLMITILYSCAEIYLTLPLGLNTTMFLCQMAALDIGGYGLAALARMAKRDGDLTGAKKAQVLGRFLIGIMLVSVVVAGLEQKITIPDQVKAIIDLALIVIRSACSVFYGKIVHELRSDHGRETLVSQSDFQQIAGQLQADIQEKITQAMESVTAKVDQQLAVIHTPPALDLNTLTDAVSNRLREQMEVFLNERVSVSPVFETPQLLAPESVSTQAEQSVSTQSSQLAPAVSKTPARRVSKTPARAKKNSNVEIVRRSRKASDEEIDAVVHPILDKDASLSHRKIAPVVNLPETTVYNSVKRYRAKHHITVSGSLETPENGNAAM